MTDCSIYTTSMNLTVPPRAQQKFRSKLDARLHCYMVLPEKASSHPAAVPNPLTRRGHCARLVAPYTQTAPPAPMRSAFVDAMSPLAQWAPAAYEWLEAVLMKRGVEHLIAEVMTRGSAPNGRKPPLTKNKHQTPALKLTQHGRNGVNTERRFSPEVDDIRRRYPELQRHTLAFCAVCVVLELWVGATKVDTRGCIERPPYSALTKKMAALNFYRCEIDTVGALLYWQPDKSKRPIR